MHNRNPAAACRATAAQACRLESRPLLPPRTRSAVLSAPVGPCRNRQKVRSLPADDQPTISTAFHLTLDVGRPVLEGCSRVLQAHERVRLDDSDDATFFETPRLMHHVSPWFRSQLTRAYNAQLSRFTAPVSILDLCSSAHSHLPPPPPTSSTPRYQVVGHGMNAEELSANPHLNSWFIQDLNRRTLIDLPSCSQHAVLCCCGVQYLQWPEEVAIELLRVLQPGGVLLVSFSGDCWKEKAIAGWLGRELEGRVKLVEDVLTAGGFEQVTSTTSSPSSPLPQSPGALHAEADDVFCLVTGYRPVSVLAPEPEPGETASDMVPIALKELDLREVGYISEATLERWRQAYQALGEDARDLGIPASAVPPLSPNAGVEEIKRRRDYLQDMIASFLSAGL